MSRSFLLTISKNLLTISLLLLFSGQAFSEEKKEDKPNALNEQVDKTKSDKPEETQYSRFIDTRVERVGISDNFKTVFAKISVPEGMFVELPQKESDIFFLQVHCKLQDIPRELYPVTGKFLVKSKEGSEVFGYLFLSDVCSSENIIILDRERGISSKNLIRFNKARQKDPKKKPAKKDN